MIKSNKDVLAFSAAEKSILNASKGSLFSVPELMERTNLPRTTIIDNLKLLDSRGLLVKYKRGRRYLYGTKEVHHVLENFLGKGSEFVKINQGINSLMNTWQRISLSSSLTRVCLLQPRKSLAVSVKKVPKDFLEKIHREQVKNNIIFDSVVSEGEYVELKKNLSDKAFSTMRGRAAEITIIPQYIFSNTDVEMILLPEVAYLNDWKREVGIEIQDTSTITFLHSLFEGTNLLGKKVDHNRTMDSYLN